MADRLKGITLEIGGDTQDLSKSLKDVNGTIKNTQTQLKDVQKLLKLDPTNTELLRQKQQLFRDAVAESKEKLEALKQAQATMDANGVDKNSEQYMALQREIISTTQDVERLEDAANQSNVALEQVGAVAQKVADGAGKVADATRGLSAAAGGALVAIGGMAYKAATTADDLNTLAKQSGFTTAELQKMQYAGDLIDTSMDDITSSAIKLKRNMISTSSTVKEAFDTLGISVRDSTGQLRDSTTVYWEIINALSQVENGTERDTLAMTLLGKSADSLAGIIDDGGQALRQLGDEAERAGLIMSQETLDGLNVVNDEIDTLKAKATATLRIAGAKAISALLPVIQEIVAMLAAALEWIGSLNTEQVRMLVTILAVVTAISPIASIVAGIANAISALIPVIMAMNVALAANPYLLLAAAFGALITLLGVAFIANIDKAAAAWTDFTDTISAEWESVKETLAQAADDIGAGIQSGIDAVVSGVKNLLNAGISLVEGFVNSVIALINSVINAINSLVGAVTNALGISYSGIRTMGSVRFPKLAKGGEVLSGTALVGEAGPELLTVAGGRTVVTPLTSGAAGGAAAYAAPQQTVTKVDVSFSGSLAQLANILQPVIVAETTRRGEAFVRK
nr:MAG TPA: tail tape measure [Caudoviricetes sp.]